jgi:peptidoglycan hydrolase-like protein with peptidoglycan-binding domain
LRPRGKLTYSGRKQTNRVTSGAVKKVKKLLKRTTVLRLGADNDPEAVKQLQHLFNELGLAGLNADGQFSESTEAAVKAAQTKLGMEATGRATQALVRRLREAHALSPCVDRSASQVAASAFYPEWDDELEQVWAAAGHDVTPGHDRLHHWWVYGPGRGRWSTWTELLANLVEEVHDKPLETLKKWASRWFFERHHYYAGSDLNRVKHGKPPRGDRIGPG